MVSVIIPAYNSEKTLAETVRSALAQTCPPLEILILDDFSTDGTRELAHTLAAEDSRIRVLENKQNLGVAETRNRGMAEARGEFFAFLDGDDLWLPEKLALQLERMDQDRLDLCYTAYSFVDGAGNEIRRPYPVPETVDFSALLRENVIGCSTVLLRRASLEGAHMRGEYAHEDYVFWLELLRGGCRAGGVNRPLMRYRVSETNRSGNKGRAARERWRIYREFLGMGWLQAGRAFVSYAVRGINKHFFKF